MNYKVKTFESDKVSSIETEINEFLADPTNVIITVVSIQWGAIHFENTGTTYSAILLYETV